MLKLMFEHTIPRVDVSAKDLAVGFATLKLSPNGKWAHPRPNFLGEFR